MSAAATVTAVVVAFDSADVLPACIAALKREGCAILVVDNASHDGSAAIAESLGAAVIRNQRNEGYGRANNTGVGAAGSDLVLIVNPDVIVDPGALGSLADAAERFPDAALLAPRLVEPDGRVFYQPRSLLAPYLKNPRGPLVLPEGDCCAPFLSGACLLVRRRIFLEMGGFDERIFLFYEDDDLCRRLAERGHSLVHVNAAGARHQRGRSSAQRPGRTFTSRWHQAWSRAYVSRKYGLADPALSAFLLNAVKTVLACFSFSPRTVERYAGSAAGALAALVGRSALRREGLTERST